AFLMSVLIIVFFIDWDHKIIPNGLVITGLIGSAVLVVYNVFFKVSIFGQTQWWSHLLGLLPGTGFFLLIFAIAAFIYKNEEAFGFGDVKIFAPIGIFLGWKLCFVALFLSIVSGGVISMILLVFKIKGRKDAIPFGPYIVIGTFITILYGTELLNLYLYHHL
ncbi:MAG TPA: A24 family peptidase, partial [Clostridia bacterium]|nr:A24 family peptidase [Clostridia bacterium]